jgi:formiminoglutamase
LLLQKLKKFLCPQDKPTSFRPDTVGEKMSSIWQWTETPNYLEGKYIILGVPDDRGVVANHGHAGAKEGPAAFRKAFYSLYDTQLREYNSVTHHPYPPTQKQADTVTTLAQKFVDAGDVLVADTIAQTHENIALAMEYFLNAGADTVFVIGGGHDFSYGSYKGHVAARKNEMIPIINFDAHFDLRPVENGSINSGTAFYRIIQDFRKNISGGEGLLEIGIQRERNPHFLYQFAYENKIPIVEYLPLLNMWRDLQQAHTQLPLEHVRDHIDDCAEYGFNRQSGSLHLSICLDIFNQSIAPGTSASSPFGIYLRDISDALVFFAKARTCRVVDIAELCPPRDVNDQTARLVASLVYRFALVREEYASR